mmetsp:Transcript_13544/g.34756  ORF Transcript_13544/g.34756 Transcript_13544/m.34756 type:complete len:240 (+) Transcript_13544:192-911(+)|eukprot:jgi/Tetstr1/463121/TSEL_008055.t1
MPASGAAAASMARARQLALAALLLLLSAAAPASALKLRITDPECMTKQVSTAQTVEGSFVSLRGGRGMFGGKALFSLKVTDPNGKALVDVGALSTYKFKLVGEESGRYTFCLAVWEKGVRTKEGQAGPGKAEAAPRDVMWELHVGHKESRPSHDKAQSEHVDELWEQISELEDKLESLQYEQAYHKNIEADQKLAAEQVGRRLTNYAILRSCALVGTSAAQVFFIQRLFGNRRVQGMLG